MEELYKILRTQLIDKFGSEERADSVLERVGELVIVDLVDAVMVYVDENKLNIGKELQVKLEEGDMSRFLELAKVGGVPVEEVFDKVSKKVIQEVFTDVK